ncbi:MAG: hypothetical protein KKB79_01725 [Nanoarchaeota archaeon]|nr:hypothetical protein [Nanoarchaeota archaeon]
MPEISLEDARQRLDDTVDSFDWVGVFMSDPSEFLQVYRAYHAQLREGDELKVEPRRIINPGGYGIEYAGIEFKIMLYRKGKEEEFVYSMDSDGSTSHGPILYSK